jgi:hypothetical protein
MRYLQMAIGLVGAAMFVGCSQPVSPTTPTSASDGSSSIRLNRSGDGISGEPLAASVLKQAPFKGKLEGGSTVAFDPPPSSFATVLFEGTGNATRLGRFTISVPHRVNFATGSATGTMTFTAANGDALTADFTGQSAPTTNPGVHTIVEKATITGGTGRFAGTVGSFIVERALDLTTLETSGSFEGTISVTGSATP